MIDPDLRVTAWDERAEQLTGVLRREATGRSILELLFSDPSGGDALRAESQLRLDGSWTGTSEGRARSSVAWNLKRSDDIGLAGEVYVAVGFELVGRQETPEQLLRSSRMAAMGQLAGGIAHEFRNIMTVISGYTEMAIRRLQPGQPFFEAASEIHRAAWKANELTQRLLTFSRAQSGSFQIVALNEIIEQARRLLSSLLGEEVELRFEAGPDLYPIKADAAQIEQILVNLAINARDAMPRGGLISIATANRTFTDPEGRVPAGEYVELSFGDSGSGMSSTVVEQIFDPFFTTKESDRGTGLGLTVVQGIVREHNGEILVDSFPGEGTRFRVFLPRSWERPSAVSPALPEGLPTGRETLLLVEDEDLVRKATSRNLKYCGYNVLEAATPHQALSLFHQHRDEVKMLITDVIMPELSGPELSDVILLEKPKLKVIFMSGYPRDYIVDRGVSVGDGAFLQKPFSLLELAGVIRQLLDE